jgi:hypothetical protein
MDYFNDTKERLAFVAEAVGWPDPSEYSVAERERINAIAKEEDREIELYPVVHAWRTNYHGGSQLTFLCRYCKDHHVHGRHGGPSHIDSVNRWDAEDNWVPRIDAVLPLRLWRRYLQRFGKCTYNDRVPGGRGVCTCPAGSGDGHRVAHCWNTDSAYYKHGYVLHEVEPNDVRALQKLKRTRKS